MRIIVRPAVDPQKELDLTHRLVSAIAEELWRLHAGNEQLNWLEAERHLEAIVSGARAEALETVVVPCTPARGEGRTRQSREAGRRPMVGRERGRVDSAACSHE